MKMARCRRHLVVFRGGWADPRRRAALLVACVLSPEYATFLAPGSACGSAQRDRMLMMLGTLAYLFGDRQRTLIHLLSSWESSSARSPLSRFGATPDPQESG